MKDTGNNVFLYDRNRTMQMICKQDICNYSSYKDMIQDVIDAYEGSISKDTCIDIFLLGIICGKEECRKKKAVKAHNVSL